ncbi:DNA/RNA nuclease SfsA [Rickettsiales bacterium LUAb2]
MQFENQLIEGKLIKRYKRFLADVSLYNGEIVTVHCPNSGSMLEVAIPNSTVYLSKVTNPTAKLPYKWEIIDINNTLIGINTSNTNRIVEEALLQQQIPELAHFNNIKRECLYKKGCRFDFEVSNSAKKGYVEVKNVTLLRNKQLAEFPDAVTARGLKHINELINVVNEGLEAYLLYVIQREDCTNFTIAKDIDPKYYMALKEAISKGVKVLIASCDVSLSEIKINSHQKIKFVL